MVNFLKIKVRSLLKCLVVISLVYILLLRKIRRRAEFNLLIPNAKPEEVWNVMADFRYTSQNPNRVKTFRRNNIRDLCFFEKFSQKKIVQKIGVLESNKR
jgi:hypothetical protein